MRHSRKPCAYCEGRGHYPSRRGGMLRCGVCEGTGRAPRRASRPRKSIPGAEPRDVLDAYYRAARAERGGEVGRDA